MYAAILDLNGNPLTPSPHLAKFWYMTRHGLARLVSFKPLVFQLLYETKTHIVKGVTCGIDPGRENIGIALVLPHDKNKSETILEVRVH